MIRVIPVLDLWRGQAVHARGGVRAHYVPLVSRLAPDATAGDARALAVAYRDVLGARSAYVADLDAIGGGAPQRQLIQEIAGVGLGIWIDAGTDRGCAVEAWTDVPGIERLIVGLETLPSCGALDEIIGAAGTGRVAFSLDLRDGALVALAPELRHRRPEEVAVIAAAAGAVSIIVINVGRVGSGTGVDEALVGRIARLIPGIELVVGGGIRGAHDLRRLAALGVHGALVGSALHDGQIGRREVERMGD